MGALWVLLLSGDSNQDAGRDPTLPASESRRFLGFFLWSAGAFGLPLAIENLFVNPLLAERLPEAAFGAFIWWYGSANLLGLSVGAAFSDVLFRSDCEVAEGERNSVRLGAFLLAATIPLALWVLVALGGDLIGLQVPTISPWACAMFAGLASSRSVQAVVLATHRIDRRFRLVFVAKLVEAMIQLGMAASLGLAVSSAAAAEIYFMASLGGTLVGFGCLVISSGLSSPRFLLEMVPQVLGFALLGFIDKCSTLAPRVALGLMSADVAEVGTFYKVASISSLFLVPVTLVSGVLRALLARLTLPEVLAGLTMLRVGGVLGGIFLLGVTSVFVGPVIVVHLYPSIGSEELGFYPVIAAANVALALNLMARPVLLRFGAMSLLRRLSIAAFAVQVVSLLFYLREGNATEAAAAFLVSSVLAAALWSASLLGTLRAAARGAPSHTATLPELVVVSVHRVCPGWRVPMLNALHGSSGIQLHVLTGRGLRGTKLRTNLSGAEFDARLLWTVALERPLPARVRGWAFHPTVLLHLIRLQPHVIVCEGGSNLPTNLVVFAYAKFTGTPVVWWTLGDLRGKKRNLAQRLFRAIVRVFERSSDAFVGYSSSAIEYLESVGIPRHRCVVALNSFDTKSVREEVERDPDAGRRLRSRLGWEDQVVFLFTGNFAPGKRVECLVKAFARVRAALPESRLMLVGAGEGLLEALELARRLGIRDAVEAPGRIVDGVGAYFLAADVFVLPGLGGMAISQAMAYGLPVVCGVADGSELDLVEDGLTGFRCGEAGDEELIEFLADRMLELARDPALRAKMGARAADRAGRECGAEAMARAACSAVMIAAGACRPEEAGRASGERSST